MHILVGTWAHPILHVTLSCILLFQISPRSFSEWSSVSVGLSKLDQWKHKQRPWRRRSGSLIIYLILFYLFYFILFQEMAPFLICQLWDQFLCCAGEHDIFPMRHKIDILSLNDLWVLTASDMIIIPLAEFHSSNPVFLLFHMTEAIQTSCSKSLWS